jgi:hypothetical protein
MKRLASLLMLLPLSLFALGCGGGGMQDESAEDGTTPASPDDGLNIQIPTDGGTPEPTTDTDGDSASDGGTNADGGPADDGGATPKADGTDAATDGESDALPPPDIKIAPPSVNPSK